MRFDIFCHIVDHFGDAGVALRLVRRLSQTLFSSSDHFTSSDKDSLRLFCDQPELIKTLAGEAMLRELMTHGVEILPWESATQSLSKEIFPDVVIETFSCELPAEYLTQLKSIHIPLIINVEYLSAESWAVEAHGLPSPPSHADDWLRYFYYPGFLPHSGGLLQGKLPVIEDYQEDVPKSLEQVWRQLRHASDTKQVCIFTYGGDQLVRFLNQAKANDLPLDLLLCDTPAIQTTEQWLGEPLTNPITRNHLQCIAMPFISQDDFDWLLFHCDLNLVRGEDSFVRAQFAGKPFIWDIYPQDEDAHLKKLDAFLEVYLKDASPNARQAVLKAMHWQELSHWWPDLQVMSQHAIIWRQKLMKSQIHGDLAHRLRDFIQEKLKQG
jgi:uncharacterized repeat protein (TIGR03837 family)